MKPISRHELIQKFKALGFDGPHSGTRHQVMNKGSFKVFIPNPHKGDIGDPLLSKILREAGISKEEWDSV